MNRMSNDLIDRKMLIRYLTISVDGRRILEYDIDNFPTTIPIKDMKEIIRNQPAAFDKEKVIEELSTLRQAEYDDSDEEPEFTDIDDILEEGKSQGRYQAYFKAIEIVEKGGIDG